MTWNYVIVYLETEDLSLNLLHETGLTPARVHLSS